MMFTSFRLMKPTYRLMPMINAVQFGTNTKKNNYKKNGQVQNGMSPLEYLTRVSGMSESIDDNKFNRIVMEITSKMNQMPKEQQQNEIETIIGAYKNITELHEQYLRAHHGQSSSIHYIQSTADREASDLALANLIAL